MDLTALLALAGLLAGRALMARRTHVQIKRLG
jgi:hypothetical protein